MEHLTGWPIAYPTPTATASEVLDFVEKNIILPFGMPRLFVSDNGPCFTAWSLEVFMKENGIKWKTVLAYAPMSNGRAKRMVRTVKAGIAKMVFNQPTQWDLALDKVLYGYRRRNLSSGFSPFELLYGVVPRMSLEHSGTEKVRSSTSDQRAAEVLAL